MTKTIRNIFIFVVSMFAFLFAGFFFVGCNIDYSIISLTSETKNIEIDVGESVDVYFKIENYQGGFDNKIDFNAKQNNNEQFEVFSVSSPTYMTNDQIRVTLKGVAGGTGTLYAKTLEAQKECNINVVVKQYSNTISSNETLKYVSNSTDFVPTSSMFEFDAHTTNKELSYYHFAPKSDFSLNTYKITGIDFENELVMFEDDNHNYAEADIIKFDSAQLEKENGVNNLYLKSGEECEKIDLVSSFDMLAIYDYSLNYVTEDDYSKLIYDISSVAVLPSLDVSVTGGYYVDDQVTFSQLDDEKIVIVPNNDNMKRFVFRVEFLNDIDNENLVKFEKELSSQSVINVDAFDYSQPGDSANVMYYEVSHIAPIQCEEEFSFKIFYTIAQNIQDDDVNCVLNFVAEIQIAPQTILVNGLSEPEEFYLYSNNKGNYGYEEFLVEISSNLNVEADFDGVYFEYDDNSLDLITANGVGVFENVLYSDLSQPFRMRGKSGAYGISTIKIILKSDILPDGEEITLNITCNIIEGANSIQIEEEYQNYRVFYLDYNDGTKDFDQILYADKEFQDITIEHDKGVNCVDINVGEEACVFDAQTGKYYLNLSVSPKAVCSADEVGRYVIYLDNGVSIEMSYKVIKVLSENSTTIVLDSEGNGAVRNATYYEKDDAGFDNVLSIEILNESSSENVKSESNAFVQVFGNYTSKDYSEPGDGIVSVFKTTDGFRFVTRKNGLTTIEITLSGDLVTDDFKIGSKVIKLWVDICSYSLLSEFYADNLSENSGIVYFSKQEDQNIDISDTSATFAIVAKNEASFGFYKYDLSGERIKAIYEDGYEIDEYIGNKIKAEDINKTFVAEEFDKKFVYYYAEVRRAVSTYTDVVITKIDSAGKEDSKSFTLEFANGLMFWGYGQDEQARNMVYTDNDGVQYRIAYSNFFRIGSQYGAFDVDTLTYTSVYDVTTQDGPQRVGVISSFDLTLISNVEQRSLNKRHNINLTTSEFLSVEGISLASRAVNLDFSNDKLEAQNVGVYVYPTYATNKDIRIDIIKTNGNVYDDLVDYEIVQAENGIYTISISCENFYAKHKNEITDIDCSLTSLIYIYPSEWGESYTSIKNHEIIKILVHYRNGSKVNPYLLETAEDVLRINKNDVSLKSAYEISSTIDMSTIQNFTPIGIVEGQLVGFSGAIIGSASSATIMGINVSDNNFTDVVDEKAYYGLFAKINANAVIENLSFEGAFNVSECEKEAYAGILGAINDGRLVNVGVVVNGGVFETNKDAYFGGIVGVNNGFIIQDFAKYAGTFVEDASAEYINANVYNFGCFFNYLGQPSGDDANGYFVIVDGKQIAVDEDGFEIYENGKRVVYDENHKLLSSVWNYTGSVSKNLVYFNDFVEVSVDNQMANLYAGGMAGKSVGLLRRHLDEDYKVNGYALYSAYTKIRVLGNALEVGLGGAAGAVERPSISYTDGSSMLTPYVLDGLLVGGEIYSNECQCDFADYVGGIVGYVEEQQMAILKNISRIFVRGTKYVGGIAGYENYQSEVSVVWGNGDDINTMEAVDDGKTAFNAAMIVRYSLDGYKKQSSVGTNEKYYYAVGRSGRVNTGSAAFNFNICSYLKNRTKIDSGLINIGNPSVKTYYGDCIEIDEESGDFNAHFFEVRQAEISFAGNDNKLTATNGEEYNVFFLYYYQARALRNGDTSVDVVDALESLNKISPNQRNYPFISMNENVSISAVDSNILSINQSQTIVISGTGVASVALTSVLDINVRQQVYFYVVNYFDKNVEGSIFYTSPSLNGLNFTDGSVVNIYGDASTSVYVIPSYEQKNGKNVDGEYYSITKDGVIRFRNVEYVLEKNAYLTTNADLITGFDNNVSNAQTNRQKVVFTKENGAVAGEQDLYRLVPVLKVVVPIGRESVEFYYTLAGGKVDVYVRYNERATLISPLSTSYKFKTNEILSDSVYVETTNANEKLFYQIFKVEDGEEILVQSKMPHSRAEVETYDIEIDEDNDLFDLKFVKNGDKFDFDMKANSKSKAFVNRFNESIYGTYKVRLYASELFDGVTASFDVVLEEAYVNYVKVLNYSNINKVSFDDNVVVPSQMGLLEILIDPVEAVFDQITISNSEKNYKQGAAEAEFQFAYERSVNNSISFVPVSTFAVTRNGQITFKYQDILKFIENTSDAIEYKGKVYVAYFLPSNNVEDGIEIGFDVEVKFGGDAEVVAQGEVPQLTTKLLSYARLSFRNKQPLGEDYYVARGLSYTLDLETYGFTREQVSISTSDESVAHVSYENGVYKLNITSAVLSYPSDNGYHVEITTLATKIVDDVQITTTDIVSIYVMEYVLNYTYIDGVNEDIVKGMQSGVIRNAIGNPYTLEIDASKFIEYNKNDSEIVAAVDRFLDRLTNGMTWKVCYEHNWETLSKNKKIKTEYYSIDGLVVTPLKIYNASSDIYHFSVDANYTIGNGIYSISSQSGINAYKMYTEFDFDIYNQSTEESPIPIETYEELLDMDNGQWYILMNDIILPSAEYAQMNDIEQFSPILANIAGFDGNGHSFVMYGTYNFDASNVGVFGSISQNAVFKNIDVKIDSAVVFNMSATSFKVGLLASQNDGVVTNCSATSVSDAAVSVVSTNSKATPSESSVAGLVATNSGFVTHSNVEVNIFTNVNLAGLVAENDGVIASSFFRNASLRNSIDKPTSLTAGLVVTNSGEIYTSYVSGDVSTCAGEVYYSKENNVLRSKYRVSGFVYTNTGVVNDCYSNIKIVSGAESTGFVYENSGDVLRCFSTSVLTSNQTSNYGFAQSNTINGERGNIQDCYYIKDDNINSSVGEISDAKIDGLSTAEFANIEGYFKNYVVSSERDISSVWFFNNGNSTQYFNGAEFNSGRIELVAPNILATSIRILDHIETIVDSETGATYAEYVYVYSTQSEKLGSMYNPYVIYNAQTFENYISQENDELNHNDRHYRIVCDIDYEEYNANSKLYKTIFTGYLEGNFMTISGILSASNETLTTAGIFASVGYAGDANSIGAVMNLTIVPSVVSFSNASIVGGFAGTIDGGTLVNININVVNENAIVLVDGKNIVGGIVGLAIGDYLIQNVTTQLCARATRQNVSVNDFVLNSLDYSNYSFAGGVVGVLSGNGVLYGVQVKHQIHVLGDKAGLIAGFVDEEVRLENVCVEMSYGHTISAYSYGGFVVGESKGTLKNIKVIGNGDDFTDFSKTMSVPHAVGGVVGLANGGIIDGVETSQSIKTTNRTTDDYGITYLGGVVGLMGKNTTISDIKVENVMLTGREFIGGVVGGIADNCGIINVNDIKVNNFAISVSGRNIAFVGVGGFVGYVGISDYVNINTTKEINDEPDKNEFNVSSVNIVSYVYNMGVTAYVGAVVGYTENDATLSVSNTKSGVSSTNVSIYNMAVQSNQQLGTFDYISIIGTGNENHDDSLGNITFSIPNTGVEGYTLKFVKCI